MYPDSDQDAPGSEISTENGDIDGTATQLTEDDTLDDTGVEDPLDRGYSPPDREPAPDVPTPEEERRGETLDERLAEEYSDADAENSAARRNAERTGRLYDDDGDEPVTAQDAGIDGAAASAEEAAMHQMRNWPPRGTSSG
jgi:hypothetical protein